MTHDKRSEDDLSPELRHHLSHVTIRTDKVALGGSTVSGAFDEPLTVKVITGFPPELGSVLDTDKELAPHDPITHQTIFGDDKADDEGWKDRYFRAMQDYWRIQLSSTHTDEDKTIVIPLVVHANDYADAFLSKDELTLHVLQLKALAQVIDDDDVTKLATIIVCIDDEKLKDDNVLKQIRSFRSDDKRAVTNLDAPRVALALHSDDTPVVILNPSTFRGPGAKAYDREHLVRIKPWSRSKDKDTTAYEHTLAHDVETPESQLASVSNLAALQSTDIRPEIVATATTITSKPKTSPLSLEEYEEYEEDVQGTTKTLVHTEESKPRAVPTSCMKKVAISRIEKTLKQAVIPATKDSPTPAINYDDLKRLSNEDLVALIINQNKLYKKEKRIINRIKKDKSPSLRSSQKVTRKQRQAYSENQRTRRINAHFLYRRWLSIHEMSVEERKKPSNN